MKVGEAVYKSQQKPDAKAEEQKQAKPEEKDNVVDADFEDINTSLLFSFKAISLIANLANKEFNRGILILHSKPNNLPVIAETDITCAQQFFIYEKMGEKKWRKDCLSIKHN